MSISITIMNISVTIALRDNAAGTDFISTRGWTGYYTSREIAGMISQDIEMRLDKRATWAPRWSFWQRARWHWRALWNGI